MINLTQFLDFIKPYGNLGSLIIFLILIACGLGVPIPEDIPLIASGILSGLGIINFWTANIIGFAGVLIGDGIIFSLGYLKGSRIKRFWLFKKLFTTEREAKIKYWFKKYGSFIIFFARFMPGLRMPIFMSSGIFHVQPWKFFALDGFAAIISVPVWIYLGHKFGENIEYIEHLAKNFQFALAIIIAIAVLVATVYYIKKKIKH